MWGPLNSPGQLNHLDGSELSLQWAKLASCVLAATQGWTPGVGPRWAVSQRPPSHPEGPEGPGPCDSSPIPSFSPCPAYLCPPPLFPPFSSSSLFKASSLHLWLSALPSILEANCSPTNEQRQRVGARDWVGGMATKKTVMPHTGLRATQDGPSSTPLPVPALGTQGSAAQHEAD